MVLKYKSSDAKEDKTWKGRLILVPCGDAAGHIKENLVDIRFSIVCRLGYWNISPTEKWALP